MSGDSPMTLPAIIIGLAYATEAPWAGRAGGVFGGATLISQPSAQAEGTLSRRLEHKSFISKPLESKARFIALSDGRVTGIG
jgi:hypothetical protein